MPPEQLIDDILLKEKHIIKLIEEIRAVLKK